jgi:hypothetical protein
MAFVITDRVRETSTTTGTGNFTLAGAVDRFRTFDSVLDTGDTTYYTIADQSGVGWEVGIATFTSPSTLARTTILSSSNGGSAVNFGAGSKDVFITLPASRTVTSVDGGSTGLTPSTASYGAISLGGTLVVGNGGTGTATTFTAGSVVFAGASGVYSQDNSNLFWDDANNRLGIGTSAPGERLQVSGGNLSVLGATGTSFTGFVNQNNGASASAYRGLFYDARNENSIAVVNMLANVETDGSASWTWSTTPAGSRTSDRRVDRVKITGDGDLQFNSGYGSVATAYGCRAWVNFNGTGTVAIRASGNVTSITDGGTGTYTVNLTTAMPDANYSAVVSCGFASGAGAQSARADLSGKTSSACPVTTHSGTGTNTDSNNVSVAIFR